MNWLCDFCGYENEFNDVSQPTECICCGELASKAKISIAWRELEAYRREKERKARFEKMKQKQELLRQRFDRITRKSLVFIKAVPVISALIVIVSIARIGMSFHSQKFSIPDWNTQLKVNVMELAMVDLPANVQDHVSALALKNKFSSPFVMTGQVLKTTGINHFTQFSTNMDNEKKLSRTLYLQNMKNVQTFISNQKNHMQKNYTMVLNGVGENLKEFENNVPTMWGYVTTTTKNFIHNFAIFWTQTKINVQTAVKFVSQKGGIYD